MKLLFSALALLASVVVVQARPVQGDLSKQELFDQSDLVVVAQPISTEDTSEQRILPGMEYAGTQVIGVETKLRVSVVLKGRKSTRNFVLHYFTAYALQTLVP